MASRSPPSRRPIEAPENGRVKFEAILVPAEPAVNRNQSRIAPADVESTETARRSQGGFGALDVSVIGRNAS
jgi:hypothetical protein